MGYLDGHVAARAARAFLSGNMRSYIAANVFEFGITADGMRLNVRILKIRTSVSIDIEAGRYIPCRIFFDALVEILRFNMVFLGYFPVFDGIQYIGEGGKAEHELAAAAAASKRRFWDLYRSDPAMPEGGAAIFCYADENDYTRCFENFSRLRAGLGEGYLLFLAAASASALPERLKFSFLAGSFESLSALLAERGMLTVKIDSLKAVLAVLIAMYGTAIFRREAGRNTLPLAARMEATRNLFRRLSADDAFSEEESAVYREKLSLLYRHILMQLIGVDYARYRAKLSGMTKELDARDGVVDHILSGLSSG